MFNKTQYLALATQSSYSDSGLDTTQDVAAMLKQAKLDFEYVKSPVNWKSNEQSFSSDRYCVISRSDTNLDLGIVGKDFKVVQPREIVGFYHDLCNEGDFSMEAIGQVDSGAKIWCLAKLDHSARIMGNDAMESYLFGVTGNDGSTSTRFKFISKRLICNNMLNAAIASDGIGGWSKSYRHSTGVPFEQILSDMKDLPSYWESFVSNVEHLSETKVTDREAYKFFYDQFMKKQDDPTTVAKRVDGLMNIYMNHHTQQLRSTRNTAWGLVNAVTFNNDHVRGRTPETRFKSSMMGEGERQKAQVWNSALKLVA